MYFEDIFKRAKKYWDKPIEVGKVGTFYTEEVEDKYKEGDEHPISDWIDVINWSIAIILTDKEKEFGEGEVQVSDISIDDVEKRFLHDLKNQLEMDMLFEYKGFKVKPKKGQKVTESYLANI